MEEGALQGVEAPTIPLGTSGSTRTTGPVLPSPLVGRYALPRPQPAEKCTLHNFSVIPINDNVRDRAASSSYRGGTTMFDFTQLQRPENLVPVLDPVTAPAVGQEVGF
jgi:hypothetical protein